MVFACIHADTNFYCLLPGLVLWLYDWTWRFWGGAGLSRSRTATIEDAQNGWTRITLLPSNKASGGLVAAGSVKKSGKTPLQTYYINLPSASKTQCHAMSAISASTNEEPQFLFRPCESPGWTSRVADMSALELNQTIIRLEGPYTPNLPAMRSASNIICFVGGTGITGALSIADWWIHNGSSANHLSIYWSVRNIEMAQLPEWNNLCELAKDLPSLHLIVHITSKLGRMDLGQSLKEKVTGIRSPDQSTWVYISGPEGLLDDGEDACLAFKRELGRDSPDCHQIDWYAARWEV